MGVDVTVFFYCLFRSQGQLKDAEHCLDILQNEQRVHLGAITAKQILAITAESLQKAHFVKRA